MDAVKILAKHLQSGLQGGAGLVVGDPTLARDAEALNALVAKLGDRAPVLRQIAEGLVRLADGKEPARELVSLAATVGQVRAAQATLAPIDSQPSRPLPETQTPCPTGQVYGLVEALTHKGPGRLERLQTAAADGTLNDLRLFDTVVGALADDHLGPFLAETAVSLCGRAIAPALERHSFAPTSAAEVRRLSALLRVLPPDAAEPLMDNLLATGAPPVRVAVIETRPAGLQSRLPSLLQHDGSTAVRKAAAAALEASPEAARLLMELLDKADIGEAAAQVLGSVRYRFFVPELQALLAEARTRKKLPLRLLGNLFEALGPHRSLGSPRVVPHADQGGQGSDLVDGLLDAAFDLIESVPPAAKLIAYHGKPDQIKALADLLESDKADMFAMAAAALAELPPPEWDVRVPRILSLPEPAARVTALLANGQVLAPPWMVQLFRVADPVWEAMQPGLVKALSGRWGPGERLLLQLMSWVKGRPGLLAELRPRLLKLVESMSAGGAREEASRLLMALQ